MTAAAPGRLAIAARLQSAPFWLIALLLATAAVALRAQNFGNPIIHIDEQFYLLVGDRMLGGALPYVDIWDRKPIGLFVLYAAIRAVGGHGVIAYQLAATAFAGATAVVVARMALAIGGRWGALTAGLLYLMMLNLAAGQGGQAPVFYNLPVAAAAALTGVLALRQGPPRPRERWLGCLIMLLLGLAMQIKYNAMFEGIGFGLVLLWSRWRRGVGHAGLALDALAWIACALLPTAAALAAYAAMGQLPAFLYANFISILQRAQGPLLITVIRLAKMIAIVGPVGVTALFMRSLAEPAVSDRQRLARRLAAGWFALACGSVLAFGSYFNHYALPLMAPAALAAAPVLGGRVAGRRYGWLLLLAGLVLSQLVPWDLRARHGGARQLAIAVNAMRPSRNCAYVYDGYPAVYYETGRCFPTLHPFPAHQQQTVETYATGIDQTAEVARIMSLHPDRVMTVEPAYPEENLRSRAALYAVLDRDYRPVVGFGEGKRRTVIYALKPGIAPLPNAAVRPGAASPR